MAADLNTGSVHTVCDVKKKKKRKKINLMLIYLFKCHELLLSKKVKSDRFVFLFFCSLSPSLHISDERIGAIGMFVFFLNKILKIMSLCMLVSVTCSHKTQPQ